MDTLTNLFQTTGTDKAVDSVVDADDFGTDGALPKSGGKLGSGGFGLDRMFGSSQNIPIVGPVVGIFQAFRDEKAARNIAARIDFNAKAEELIGKQQTVNALRDLNDVQAFNVVAGFASGGGLAGSRGRAALDVSEDADLDLSLIRTNAEIRSGELKQKARIVRKIARFDRNVAVGTSLFRIVNTAVGAAT